MARIIERFKEEAKKAERVEAALERIEKYARKRNIPTERDGSLVVVSDSDHFAIGIATSDGRAIVMKVEVLGEEEA